MPKGKEEGKVFIDPALGNLLENPDQLNFGDEEKPNDENGGEEVTLEQEEIEALEKEKGEPLTEEELAQATELKAKALGEKEEEIEEEVIPDEFELIQPEKLPKELRPHFKRMLAAYTKKMEKVANISKKAELFDYLQENPQFFVDKFVPKTVKSEMGKEAGGDTPEQTFFKQLGIPEDHELAPAFKALASFLYKNTTEAKTEKETEKADNFKKGLTVWLNSETNKGIKDDTEMLRKMDELGMENPRLYGNLDRLLKFAETDLGRKARRTSEKKEFKVDIVKLYKEMGNAKKMKVSKPKETSKSVSVKVAKNVEEAFAQAESQLQGKK